PFAETASSDASTVMKSNSTRGRLLSRFGCGRMRSIAIARRAGGSWRGRFEALLVKLPRGTVSPNAGRDRSTEADQEKQRSIPGGPQEHDPHQDHSNSGPVAVGRKRPRVPVAFQPVQ